MVSEIAIESRICVVYQDYLKSQNLGTIPSFYDVLNITPPGPDEHLDGARTRIADEASKSVLKKLDDVYGDSPWRDLFGGEMELDDMERAWLLMGEILSNARAGSVYDQYFLPIVGSWGAEKSMKKKCHWDVK